MNEENLTLDPERDLTIFLTGHCNSNCLMCPESDLERRADHAPTVEEMRSFLRRVPEDVRHFVITGGEPTLNTEVFFYVLEQLKQRFPDRDVLLLTNGRSFAAKKMVDRLAAVCPDYLTVAIPLHGHHAELHDRITQAEGSFRQTCMGIEHLHARGVIIELRVVVSLLNCEHLTELAELICDRFPFAQVVNFIGLETMGSCARNFHQVFLDYAEAFSWARPAVETLLRAGIDAGLYNFPLCTVEPGFWPLCKRSISPYKIRYADICESCEVREQCGGVFRSTLLLAKPKLTPIRFADGL